MNIKELKAIIEKSLAENNNNRNAVINDLQNQCDANPEMMIAFAKHGYDILVALNEKKRATLQ